LVDKEFFGTIEVHANEISIKINEGPSNLSLKIKIKEINTHKRMIVLVQ
jgi:hypothetical protein